MARFAMRRSLVGGVLLSLVGIVPAAAEEASSPALGTRVRVTAPTVSGKRLVGTLVRMDETTLSLRREKGDVLQVARHAVTGFEVSRRPSRKGRGAAIGALVGLGAAVAIGFAGGDDCPSLQGPPGDLVERLNRNLCIGKGQMAAVMAILTVPAGVLIGAGAAPGERWVRTTPDRVSLAVRPVRGGGVGASLLLRF